MAERQGPLIAVVDYGLGNLYSVKQACEHVGLAAKITSDSEAIVAADAVILPGVAAFGDGMDALRRLSLVEPLMDMAATGKPFFGICLGMQLLFSESEEFGSHRGLNLIEGSVVRFEKPTDPTARRRFLKIPHVGWNTVEPSTGGGDPPVTWSGTPLEGIRRGAFQYFVHSFYCKLADPNLALAVSTYGDVSFCSSVRKGNIFACQFHPERSGDAGIQIYRNIARHMAPANQGEVT